MTEKTRKISDLQSKICPKCGKEGTPEEFTGSFCTDCYGGQQKLCEVPQGLEVGYCSACERIHLNEWTAAGEEAVENWLLGKIKTKCPIEDIEMDLKRTRKQWIADLKIKFNLDGNIVEKKMTVFIRVNNSQCGECSRKSGGYFEAIIQVRRATPETPWDRLEALAVKIGKRLNRLTFVTKVEEKKEGFDLYAGSVEAARSVIEGLNKKCEISRTLAGQREGQQLYRTTFCIRT